METIEIYVSGRVQGVFFRKYTRMKALELGLKGYVKNMPDGRVYILANGGASQIQVFQEWCRIGSPTSRVTEVKSSPSDKPVPDGDFSIH